MVSFMPLDSTDEDSVGSLLSHVDNAMQYGEDEVSRAAPAAAPPSQSLPLTTHGLFPALQ
jgi:hypothetical protein